MQLTIRRCVLSVSKGGYILTQTALTMPVRDMLPKEVIFRHIAPRAVSILGGTLDEVVPAYMAQQLYRSAAQPKELWIVSGAGHADFSRVVSEQYRDRLIDFFRRRLFN
jgi:fermentation-respiration switch protein FrsA (DUF1100 family)